MSIANICRPLNELVQFLDRLQSRAPLDQLRVLLEDLNVSREDLEPFIEFGELTYRRNLICEGEWYELLCICWRSGQRSPIHNHAGSTCGLRIVEGIATETVFEFTPSGLIKPVQTADAEVGFVCTTQDEDIHQVSNLQGEGEDLITLHIYSPPLRRMDNFSLYDRQRGLYEPTNFPVCWVGDCI
ncbi:MAG TPA: cysteine dioxygenase family protein [Pirellulaceae bacterium]|nr:cysteine dioxygenase family protein [Pirellulaceae bacterium]